MKTLIFNGSPRKSGGTATLISKIKEKIHGEINIVNSYNSNISPCIDCRYCWTHDKCAIQDDMQNVYRYIDEADNIIIASPVYFGELTGSLLALMSRLQYFWISKNIRKESVLSPKKRNGVIVLVDAGEGYTESAMAMGKRLLRIMGSDYMDSVYFSGTENLPKADTFAPKYVLDEIDELASKLFDLNNVAKDDQRLTRIYPIILREYNPE